MSARTPPLPAGGQLAPPWTVQIQLAPVNAAGKASTTVVEFAVAGPAFVTVIVYVSGSPAVYCVEFATMFTPTSASLETAPQLTTARMTQSPNTPSVEFGNQANWPPPSEA